MSKMRTAKANQNEQHLLLQLLELNASLLSRSYAIDRWPEEAEFQLSFILPCFPLDSPLLARLEFPVYCSNGCDNEASLACGACGLARYCTPGV